MLPPRGRTAGRAPPAGASAAPGWSREPGPCRVPARLARLCGPKPRGSRHACMDQRMSVSGSVCGPGIAASRLAGIPGRGGWVFLAADDDHGLEAGLGDVQAYLAEARSSQLADQVLGLAASQTVGGVPARRWLGQAL